MKTVLPAYYQIRETIKSWIYNKEYNPGDRFPTEKELAERFKVNRLTVRQAVSQLVQEGFLQVHRGEGTFVTSSVALISRLSLESTGYLDDLNLMSRFKTRFVKTSRIQAARIVKEKLALREGEDEVVQVKRLRLLKDNIAWYTLNHLPLDVGLPLIERKKDLFKTPLSVVVERDLGIKIVEAFQVIRASFADEEAGEYLSISPGSPVLVIERVMYAKDGKAIDWVQSFYPADKCEYIVRLKSPGQKSGQRQSGVASKTGTAPASS